MVTALRGGFEGWISKLMVDSAKKASAYFLSVFCFFQVLPVPPVGGGPLENAQAEPPTQPALGSPEVGPAVFRLRNLSQMLSVREGNTPRVNICSL